MNHVDSETHPDGVRFTAVDRLRIDDNGHGIWLGDKHIPWAIVVAETHRSMETRQAIIKFENGLEVSIIWGSCTYSDNYDHPPVINPDAEFVECPAIVEVGVRPTGGQLMEWPHGDTVNGYMPVAEVPALIAHVAAPPSGTHMITFGGAA